MKRILQKIARHKLMLAATALAFSAHIARAQTELPDVNAFKSCQIKNDSMSLIKSAKIGKAPDNLRFKGGRDPCDFYERAEQMFLWLTSPTPSKYGQGSYVFNSPMFYNAWSTSVGASPRSLVPITPDEISRGAIRLDVKIDIEPGQADATVLMTQDHRLVYYLVEVNDVYAYFVTGIKSDKIKAAKFPSERSDLDDIKKFGRNHKKELADANILAVELKSAWIETIGFKLSKLKKYVTMEATIPIYGSPPSSPTTPWIRKGFEKRQLALIGMHVVFSAKGHSEMLWATFEHVNNTRNQGYTYFAKGENSSKMNPADTDGSWVFSASDPLNDTRINNARMHFDKATGHILAYKGETIGPSNILRESPWGTEPDRASDNTQNISINKQARDLLARDVR